MPPEPELNALLEQLMDEMAIKDSAKRNEMLKWPNEKKWGLLTTHSNIEDSKIKKDDVKEAIEALEGKKITDKAATSLRVALASEPVRWISKFLESNGLDLLLEQLNYFESKQKKRRQ